MSDTGGTIRVELNHTDPASLPRGFRPQGQGWNNDSRILAVAKNLADEGADVTLVSKDLPLRIKASAVGLDAEEYRAELAVESGWTGMAELEVVGLDIDELYDAFKHARSARPELPLLGPAEARRYVGEVRDKVFDVLERTPLEGHRLVDGGFAFGMIVQHEQQHDETMLATHQLRSGAPVLTADPPPAAQVPVTGEGRLATRVATAMQTVADAFTVGAWAPSMGTATSDAATVSTVNSRIFSCSPNAATWRTT